MHLQPLHSTLTQTFIYSCFFCSFVFYLPPTSNIHHVVFIFLTYQNEPFRRNQICHDESQLLLPPSNPNDAKYYMRAGLVNNEAPAAEVLLLLWMPASHIQEDTAVRSHVMVFPQIYLSFKATIPYWATGNEPLSCSFEPEKVSISYVLLIFHKRPRVIASVEILWQIVLL